MMRRTALKRTPMKRKPRRRPAMTPEEYELVMITRALGRCEARVSPACSRAPEAWHHRQTRAVGDNSPAKGLALGTHCHVHVHANPEEAREHGWIVSRHHPNPGEVPVLIRGSWWVLDSHGSMTEVEK